MDAIQATAVLGVPVERTEMSIDDACAFGDVNNVMLGFVLMSGPPGYEALKSDPTFGRVELAPQFGSTAFVFTRPVGADGGHEYCVQVPTKDGDSITVTVHSGSKPPLSFDALAPFATKAVELARAEASQPTTTVK